MAPQCVAGELYESITGQLFELGRQLRQPNGYPFDPLKLKRHLQMAIEGKFDGLNIYPVKVDYGQSIEDMVTAGQYNWSNSDITSANFPTKQSGVVELNIELVHFDRSISTNDALKELDRMGLRPAETYEILAFGAKYPEIQREFPVVALCSPWRYSRAHRVMVCLGRDGSRRKADLGWVVRVWGARWRFAGVRK